MELTLTDTGNTIAVSDRTFGQVFNEHLVHQTITAYLAGGRSASKAQKNRAAVNGGGAKPWRQKGTGRARAGTSSSPIWRGGGVTFATGTRNFHQKLNKKMFRTAMRCILSELARQDRLVVVEEFNVEAAKTQLLQQKLQAMALESVLMIVNKIDDNLYLAARNLRGVEITLVDRLNPVSLVQFERVLLTVPAVKQIEAWLS